MTIDHAKFVLQAYRPGQNTEGVADLEEALKMLKENADLQVWFAAEQDFDNAFSRKLATIEAPLGLAEQILSQVIAKQDKVVEFPWWKQFSLWGAAASILLVLSLLLLPERQITIQDTAMTIESFEEFASQALKNSKGFNLKSHEWTKLVQYLDEHQTPAPSTLPGKIDKMPTMGCKTLNINGKPVGVICFGKNSKSHLFVINSEDFPQLPVKEKPVLGNNAYASTAYWSKSDKHYFMLSYDPEELSQFVSF